LGIDKNEGDLMVTIHEYDRCKKVIENLEKVKSFEYFRGWWNGTGEIELCNDCWKK